MMSFKPTLLAPEIATQSAEAFHAHVSALKRIPNRSASKRPKTPKLPKLQATLCIATSSLLLTCGEARSAIVYTVVKDGRKKLKLVSESDIASAAQALLQTIDAVKDLALKRKLLIRKDSLV